MNRTRRGGYTLVELTVAAIVVAILARIAMPLYQDMTYKARAAATLGDLNAIRVAAYSYNADSNRWPADTQPGEVPPELLPYLGDDFTFDRDHYQLDWENWVLPDGTPRHPDTRVLLGVSIVTSDARLGQALEEIVPGDGVRYTLGSNYTFIIASN